jgi:hypothetical protein
MITYKVFKQTPFWTSPILRSARVNQGIGHSLCGRCQVRTFSSQKEWAFALARFGARFLGQGVSFVYRSGLSKKIPLKSLLIGLATPVVAGGAYFLAHSERVPYSNRLHFTWLNEKDELNLSEENRVLILQQERHHLVCPNAGIYKVTWRIVNDMLDVCEQDGIITQRRRERFSLNIIESKIPNAFVLPDGSIFLYTGLLAIAETEAGLACVLGHEISHSLARHSSEKIGIIKALILVFEFIRGLSDHERSLSATFIEFLAATVFQIGIPFAHSRAMEQEADCIGMKLAAKAGYDPAQAAAVWERMIAYEEKPKMKKQQKKEEGQGWVNSLVPAWVGAGKRQARTQSMPIEQSNTAAASVRASPVSSATSTQEMTTRDRVKELLVCCCVSIRTFVLALQVN